MTSNIALRAPKQKVQVPPEPCWIDLQRLLGVNAGNHHEARERLTQFKSQEERSSHRKCGYAKCWARSARPGRSLPSEAKASESTSKP